MWAAGSYNSWGVIYIYTHNRGMKCCCDLSEDAACYHNNGPSIMLPGLPRTSCRFIDNSNQINKYFLYEDMYNWLPVSLKSAWTGSFPSFSVLIKHVTSVVQVVNTHCRSTWLPVSDSLFACPCLSSSVQRRITFFPIPPFWITCHSSVTAEEIRGNDLWTANQR